MVVVVTVQRAGVPVRSAAAISSVTAPLSTFALHAELACTSVHDRIQRTAVTSCTITMNADIPADLHGVMRRGTIGDIANA